jgi:ATP-dependent RNA helicase DeaD
MNMGELDGFNRNSIKDFLVEISGVNARVIFNVDVKNSFSFFETENKHVDEFLALNKKGIEFNARVISFEVSKAKPSGGYGEKRSYGGGSREDSRRSYGGGERRSYGGGSREGGERKSYGGNREGGERKSYGGGESRSYAGGGERRSSFGGERSSERSGDRPSFGGGERRSFNREGGNGGGERRSFDKPSGDRPSSSGNREGAERRRRFTK